MQGANRQFANHQTATHQFANQNPWHNQNGSHWNNIAHNDHHHHHRDFSFFLFPGFFSPFFYPGFYPFYFYPYYASTYYPDFGYGPYYSAYYYGGGAMPEWYYDTTVRLPAEMPQVDGAGVPADLSAHLNVRVPADAEFWVDGTQTKQSGSLRQFVSPPLEAGQDYSYELKARWVENGREVVQTRRIPVFSGLWRTIDFTQPEAESIAPPKRQK
jgi:uncharacterized protein (TIGR03000 family)